MSCFHGFLKSITVFKGNTPLYPTRELNSVLSLKHFFSELRLSDEAVEGKICSLLLGHGWSWITGLSGTMWGPCCPWHRDRSELQGPCH